MKNFVGLPFEEKNLKSVYERYLKRISTFHLHLNINDIKIKYH
ncbi:hypothetical protein M153_15200010349 [Pseudoloma neurophilia]|uniref:Uncharacterized protein n=1 Tax=Pseudoloma neurophilia TaxID=146866 RepID=A0A0R0LZJ2_9MICR|nr:hypothetical protein M153_15200010349 [Pseudoloma neurophilia]